MISLNLMTSCTVHPEQSSATTDTVRSQAVEVLRNNLKVLSKWEKVHAAEYLLWAGYPEGVRETFQAEEKVFGSESPYRIGIWRVLAQCSEDAVEKAKYVEKILDAFRDPGGPDRLHAVETLAKLNIPVMESAAESAREILKGEIDALYVYTLWSASIQDAVYQESRNAFLQLVHSDQKDPLRMQAAYSLRNLGGLTPVEWQALADRALSEPADAMVSVYLLSAAVFTAPEDSLHSPRFINVYNKLKEAKDSPQKGARMELAHALAERGSTGDLPLLLSLLNDGNPLNSGNLEDYTQIIATPENADVRSAAAYAILKIGNRKISFQMGS